MTIAGPRRAAILNSGGARLRADRRPLEEDALNRRNRFVLALAAGLLLAGLTASCQTPPPAVKRIEANGAQLPYVDQGSGAPLVFVPAALGDYRTWDRQRAEPSWPAATARSR